MPLKGATVLQTGTVSATGGTSITYATGPRQVPGGVQCQNNAVTDFRVRPTFVARYREPKLLDDGSWTKGKWVLTLTIPKLLASGKTTLNLFRLEREIHPESTVAEAAELNIQAAQMCIDTDFSLFWSSGSLD